MERDAKVCFDALAEEDELADWFISTIMSSASDLSLYFVNCEFYCVRRSLNLIAHSATKIYVALKDSFFKVIIAICHLQFWKYVRLS